jgi:hypothetical protein
MAGQNQVSRFAGNGKAVASGGLSVVADEKAGTLTITIPLQPAGTMSKTGKSQLLASTNGNKTVRIGDVNAKLGVNCYIEV